MFCSKCGAQIPEGAAHCPQCGAPVGNAPQAQQAASQTQPAKTVQAAPKKKFTGNKLHLILMIAMFVSAIAQSWVAMALLFAVEVFFIKDKWLIRNSVQPFAVGIVVVLFYALSELISGTAVATYAGLFGDIVDEFFYYTYEAVYIAAIVFLVIGVITLFKGEVRIPLFSKIADAIKDEE